MSVFVTNITSMLGIGVAVDYSLFLLSRYREELQAGKTREQAYPTVRKQVDALGNVYAKVGSVITAAADIDTLDGPSILGDSRPDQIGIAVAQGPHPEIGDKAIWIVVLLAHKR